MEKNGIKLFFFSKKRYIKNKDYTRRLISFDPYRMIHKYTSSKAYFRRRAEIKRAENIAARLGSSWHASVLGEENIAVLKQLYY